MDIIQLLPDSVANQIAAGEVVQRPASVAKELVENAIDAGATAVELILEDAGRTLIQVVDDGKGMSDTDARLAFERHATSKIRKAADLFTLHTMGFRGEALPSIAAVAQVKLTTRTIESELGTQIEIEGSKVLSQTPCACAVGANFEVRNLFFNIPARRKFLKSNQTELNNIIQELERIALVNPSVAFTVRHNDAMLTQLPSAAPRVRIANIFGRKISEMLLEVDVTTPLVHLYGYVGKPEAARKRAVHQYLFVNGRFMRHPYFSRAVQEAYAQLIPVGEQIPYFLYFEVDPANIDVNIHPTKTEVKFEHEQAIWQIIVAAIHESLGRFSAVPVMEFDTEGKPDIPVFQAGKCDVSMPTVEINPNFNPFNSPSSGGSRLSSAAPANWQSLYSDAPVSASSNEFTTEQNSQKEMLFSSSPESLVATESEHLQLHGQYILAPVRSGIMLIEQHRAHVRILYDKYLQQMDSKVVTTQGLLFPEMVSFSLADSVLVNELTDELKILGFDLSPLGGGSFAINGIPVGIDGLNPVVLLTEIVDNVKDKGSQGETDVQHRIALTMARNAAIPKGQELSQIERQNLIDSLFACANPNYSPDGKLIVTIIQTTEIDKTFK